MCEDVAKYFPLAMALKSHIQQLLPVYQAVVQAEDTDRWACPSFCLPAYVCLSVHFSVCSSNGCSSLWACVLTVCIVAILQLWTLCHAVYIGLLPPLPYMHPPTHRAYCLCRIFTEMAESFLYHTIHHPSSELGDLHMFDMLLECVSHPDYEVNAQ